jgi:uncharacterized protein
MEKLVEKVSEYIQNKFKDSEGSHDWHHIERVWKLSKYIQQKEGGDLLVIELAALLHDVSDHKYNGGDWEKGSQLTAEILLDFEAPMDLIQKIQLVVSQVSFKGAKVADLSDTVEAKIVQDADRLDAIGAIGIARAFSYGGSKHRPLFDPAVSPILHQTADEYKNSVSHTVNHFYEKLFLLKDRMNTITAKSIATKRHALMEAFLEEFYSEWKVESLE